MTSPKIGLKLKVSLKILPLVKTSKEGTSIKNDASAHNIETKATLCLAGINLAKKPLAIKIIIPMK
jgi:hypothetical protein